MSLILSIIFICLLLAYVFVCRHYLPHDNKSVPTHSGKLPIIGHVYLFLKVDEIFQKIISFGQFSFENGGVSKIFVGPLPIYIVTDPHDVSTVLNKCLDKMFVYRYIEPMVGKMLVAAEVPIWKRNRRIIDLGFKQHLLDEYLELFKSQADRLVKSMDKEVGKGNIDLTKTLTRNILETTCRTTMGTRVDDRDLVDESYVSAVDEFMEILTTRIGKPWLMFDWIFERSIYKTKSLKTFHTLFKLSGQMVHLRKVEHLERLQNKQCFESGGQKFKSLLDVLIENSVTETSSLYTNDELRNIVDNVLLAAYDTTIYEMLFILVCLGTYPEVQEKIYHEINHVLGEDAEVSKEDLSKLIYLDAVINESVRLYPIAAVIGRQATTDTMLRNVTIPAGSSILVHIWAINRNTKYWGSDANEFKPERWLNSTTFPDNPAAYASFSPGRRGCVGKAYALMFFKVTLIPIIRKFKLTADHTKMKLDCKVMIKPTAGHLVKIENRY